MKYASIFTRGALACAVACIFAAPSFALEAPDHIKKHHQKVTADAKAAAAKAREAAKAAAEKAAAAEKVADAHRKGLMVDNRPKVFQTHFNVNAVKPYVDDLNRMAVDMKSVTTPQQATAYAAHFQKDLPRLHANFSKMKTAMPHLEDGLSSGKVTPEMTQAANLLSTSANDATEAAIHAEMNRISKLNPGIIPHFKAFDSLHDAP